MPSVLHRFACSDWFSKNPFQIESRKLLAVELDSISALLLKRYIDLTMDDTFLMFHSEVFGMSIVFTHREGGVFIV